MTSINARRRWRDLSAGQRVAVSLAAAAELAMKAAAVRDLRRRPADQVRGDKRLWLAAQLVNFVGPVAYFALGRRVRR